MTPDGVPSGTAPTSSSGANVIPLADEASSQPEGPPTTLYRFFDADDRLLYVGITSRGPSRWSEHRANRPWWHAVVRSTMTHYPTRAAAVIAEMHAIQTEHPLHNIHRSQNRTRREARRPPARGHRVGMRAARWAGDRGPVPLSRQPLVDFDLDEDLLDAEQAAEYMGLSHRDRLHVTALRFPGELEPAVSRGAYIRLWLRQDLDRFLKKHPGIGKRTRDADEGPS